MDRYDLMKNAVLSFIVNRGMGDAEFEYRLQHINEPESILKLASVLGQDLAVTKQADQGIDLLGKLLSAGVILPVAAGLAGGTAALVSNKSIAEQDMRIAQVNKEKARMKFLTEQLERNYGPSQKDQIA